MEKPEIKRISEFLTDVYEGICEDDGPTALRLYLDKLYATIRLLMDETLRTKDQRQKVILASPDYKRERVIDVTRDILLESGCQIRSNRTRRRREVCRTIVKQIDELIAAPAGWPIR